MPVGSIIDQAEKSPGMPGLWYTHIIPMRCGNF